MTAFEYRFSMMTNDDEKEEALIERGRAFLADRAAKRLDDLDQHLLAAFADTGVQWQGVARLPHQCTETTGFFTVANPEGRRIELTIPLTVDQDAIETQARSAVTAATTAYARGYLAFGKFGENILANPEWADLEDHRQARLAALALAAQ